MIKECLVTSTEAQFEYGDKSDKIMIVFRGLEYYTMYVRYMPFKKSTRGSICTHVRRFCVRLYLSQPGVLEMKLFIDLIYGDRHIF